MKGQIVVFDNEEEAEDEAVNGKALYYFSEGVEILGATDSIVSIEEEIWVVVRGGELIFPPDQVHIS